MEKEKEFSELVERGKKRGNLTPADVLSALESPDCELEQLETLCETLEASDIEIGNDVDLAMFSMNAEDEEQLVLETDPEEVDELLAQEGLAMDDPVRMYLKDIGKVPLLSADKELDLAYKMAHGDTVAKKQLVEANLRLVVRDQPVIPEVAFIR